MIDKSGGSDNYIKVLLGRLVLLGYALLSGSISTVKFFGFYYSLESSVDRPIYVKFYAVYEVGCTFVKLAFGSFTYLYFLSTM